MLNTEVVREDISYFQNDKNILSDILNDLYVERMQLDKEFSNFLGGIHHYDMQPEDTNNENWLKFKDMRKYYSKIEYLVKLTNFYLGK